VLPTHRSAFHLFAGIIEGQKAFGERSIDAIEVGMGHSDEIDGRDEDFREMLLYLLALSRHGGVQFMHEAE